MVVRRYTGERKMILLKIGLDAGSWLRAYPRG